MAASHGTTDIELLQQETAGPKLLACDTFKTQVLEGGLGERRWGSASAPDLEDYKEAAFALPGRERGHWPLPGSSQARGRAAAIRIIRGRIVAAFTVPKVLP